MFSEQERPQKVVDLFKRCLTLLLFYLSFVSGTVYSGLNFLKEEYKVDIDHMNLITFSAWCLADAYSSYHKFFSFSWLLFICVRLLFLWRNRLWIILCEQLQISIKHIFCPRFWKTLFLPSFLYTWNKSIVLNLYFVQLLMICSLV